MISEQQRIEKCNYWTELKSVITEPELKSVIINYWTEKFNYWTQILQFWLTFFIRNQLVLVSQL